MERNVVGARELKTRLGTYLRRVREGRTLLVTDRGEPIAELRPVAQRGAGITAELARLSAKGGLSKQESRPLARFTLIRPAKRMSAAKLISDDREDRF